MGNVNSADLQILDVGEEMDNILYSVDHVLIRLVLIETSPRSQLKLNDPDFRVAYLFGKLREMLLC